MARNLATYPVPALGSQIHLEIVVVAQFVQNLGGEVHSIEQNNIATTLHGLREFIVSEKSRTKGRVRRGKRREEEEEGKKKKRKKRGKNLGGRERVVGTQVPKNS